MRISSEQGSAGYLLLIVTHHSSSNVLSIHVLFFKLLTGQSPSFSLLNLSDIITNVNCWEKILLLFCYTAQKTCPLLNCFVCTLALILCHCFGTILTDSLTGILAKDWQSSQEHQLMRPRQKFCLSLHDKGTWSIILIKEADTVSFNPTIQLAIEFLELKFKSSPIVSIIRD